jgi:hypothetical protein
MRLWSLHPKYLDPQGLVALWREALLARNVLEGRTVGYRHHPQLQRFRAAPDPLAAIGSYLPAVHAEAKGRGYRFDPSRIPAVSASEELTVTDGQLRWEWQHLLAKLARRDPPRHAAQVGLALPEAHPLFRVVPGGVAEWERT